MKILIADDDFTSRILLQGFLQTCGECTVCTDGLQAVNAFRSAFEEGSPFTLVCLDIMMPELDGQAALKKIRDIEEERGIAARDGVKIIMTTALDDKKNIISAFREQCDVYLVKPIDKEKLVESLNTLNLID